jgi:hypothetical protein
MACSNRLIPFNPQCDHTRNNREDEDGKFAILVVVARPMYAVDEEERVGGISSLTPI